MSECECERWQALCDKMNRHIDQMLSDLGYLGASYGDGGTLIIDAKKYHQVYRKGLNNGQKLQVIREYARDLLSTLPVLDKGRNEVHSMLWSLLNEVNAIEIKVQGQSWEKLKGSSRETQERPSSSSKSSLSPSENR